MSVIAVEGISAKTNSYQVVRMFSKCIPGSFEPINFERQDRSPYKTCYLKLSDNLDPVDVVERINLVHHAKKKSRLNAFIPTNSSKSRKQGKTKGAMSDTQVLSIAHKEIMTELQYKYTGLCALSSKGSHTLLDAIGMTIHDRLKQLLASGDEELSNPFLLTGRYRKAHPHFGDFQLILGTLHRLQDAAGALRTQLQESELIVTPKDISVADNVPYTKAQEAIAKYTTRIMKKLEEHIKNYEMTPSPEDTPEEAARKKVKIQLTKMMPYVPVIMQQVVTNHFSQNNRKDRSLRMRMYGEPYLPGKELTVPLMKRHHATRITRWKSMYNLLVFDVPINLYTKIMTLDGTNLGGAKLIIRSSNAPIHRVDVKKEPELAEMEEDEEEDYSMEL